jgi:hypothetical protein
MAGWRLVEIGRPWIMRGHMFRYLQNGIGQERMAF